MPTVTKLLIVDDSALMRRIFRDLFAATGRYEVYTARNGVDALEQIERVNPDVVTLDINMPEMDGLSCLSHIMARFPRPVVMLSSLTQAGAQTTLEALGLGAVDYIGKPGGTVTLELGAVAEQLVATVDRAAKAKPRLARSAAAASAAPRASRTPAPASGPVRGLVLIGVSTGGPRTLEDILPLLPARFPWPLVVAQHMPASFTASFAARLDSISKLRVVEASGSAPVAPGHVYVARGGADLVVEKRAGRVFLSSTAEDRAYTWHPSVDRLVASALSALEPSALVGVLLTGMGDDGARQMTALREAGGRTIAEDASTAIVYGMPAELSRLGGATLSLPADRIAAQLSQWIS